MTLRWEPANRLGGSWFGFEADRLVGQIVAYDTPPGYTVFVDGRRVGVWAEWGQAVQAADDNYKETK